MTTAPATESAAVSSTLRRSLIERKRLIREQAEKFAGERKAWETRHRYFYEEEARYLCFLVPEGKRVLDLGCGGGDLLKALAPSEGIGVDFSASAVMNARDAHPELQFVEADVEALKEVREISGTFDAIVMSDTIGSLNDCLQTFQGLRCYCDSRTRLIVSYYSWPWEPVARLYFWLTDKKPVLPQNWLSSADIANLLNLSGFEVIKREWRVLVPFRLFGLGRLINRYVATLPLLRRLCMRNYVVARLRPEGQPKDMSVTIVVPCRNERGNIENAVRRLPPFAPDIEILFVEGGSSDGTWEEMERVKAAYPAMDIKLVKQTGKGKGDAVRLGFESARGDFLIILDADLTMPPEDLPKFYEAFQAGYGEFINGSPLVYPMERQAMRFLNFLANHVFALLFSYLLNQRYTDTLCGTKALLSRDYREIANSRSYFGDFDLIFGASKINLKTAEVPIRYAAREYGTTQISRFQHGMLLLRMVFFAFRKLKAF